MDDSPKETLHDDRQLTKHSIFRDEALRRYVESQEKSVLPRLLSPKIFIYLWLLVALLIVGSILIWLAIKPINDLNIDEHIPSHTKN
jgi:hypothetical protein